MTPNRILITGGLGFLGQYLTNDLLNALPDVQIHILDIKRNRAAVHDFSDHDNVRISLEKNICCPETMADDFVGMDLVIHLAGLVSFALKDRQALFDVNADGARNVLQAAREQNVPRVIHVSSVAALGYNDDKESPVNESYQFDWSIAEANKKYYMLSKRAADEHVQSFRKQGLDATILYPGLMLGPGDLVNSAKWISAIQQGRIPFNMPGGTNVVDVRDVSRGIVAAVRADLKNEDILLSGHNALFKEINAMIAVEVGGKVPGMTAPRMLRGIFTRLALYMETRAKGEPELTADNVDSAFAFRYFDNARAIKRLGWQPQISLPKTIHDTVNWMKVHGYLKR